MKNALSKKKIEMKRENLKLKNKLNFIFVLKYTHWKTFKNSLLKKKSYKSYRIILNFQICILFINAIAVFILLTYIVIIDRIEAHLKKRCFLHNFIWNFKSWIFHVPYSMLELWCITGSFFRCEIVIRSYQNEISLNGNIAVFCKRVKKEFILCNSTYKIYTILS